MCPVLCRLLIFGRLYQNLHDNGVSAEAFMIIEALDQKAPVVIQSVDRLFYLFINCNINFSLIFSKMFKFLTYPIKNFISVSYKISTSSTHNCYPSGPISLFPSIPLSLWPIITFIFSWMIKDYIWDVNIKSYHYTL